MPGACAQEHFFFSMDLFLLRGLLCECLPPCASLARFLLNFFLYLRDIPRFRVPLTMA